MTVTTSAQNVQFASIVSFLRERIIQRTKVPDVELGNDANLSDLGVTSLDAVIISGELEDRYDIEVDPAIMFQYRNINDIASRLTQMLPSA